MLGHGKGHEWCFQMSKKLHLKLLLSLAFLQMK
jgi:hypothetical protein